MKILSDLFRARRAIGLGVCLAASVSCGEVARTGRSPSYLIIETLTAASGARPGEFAGTLASDVVTLVTQTINGQQQRVPTVFEDRAEVFMRMWIKNIGAPLAPTGPTQLNFITLRRYRVVYRRADGRNTPGVDVPHPFDGAITAMITNAPISVDFTIVRLQAKIEPPLIALQGSGGAIAIATIADVTFYGADQAGNEVNVTGSISINFSDWGDPQ